jgi:hypothetical protein
MKKINILFKTIFVLTVFTLISCEEEEEYKLGELKAPTEVSLTAEIVGATAAAPNGDGSGTVHFTVTGKGAMTYKFSFNEKEELLPAGKNTYNFSTIGTHDYTVSAIAIGPGGTSTVVAKTVTVLATYTPPVELVNALTTGTWRIKKEAGGHMGVGANDMSDPIWWSAGPNEKAATGLYDDRYTFSADGTFTFDAGPDNNILTKGAAAKADFGGLRDQSASSCCDEVDNFPLSGADIGNISGKWYISAPGGVETINLSGLGFMGMYVGSHTFEILERTSDELRLKNYYAVDNNAWWWKITNKN